MRARGDPGAGEREEPGQPQIGDHDHHAEQQGDRVEVDRPVGIRRAAARRRRPSGRRPPARSRRGRSQAGNTCRWPAPDSCRRRSPAAATRRAAPSCSGHDRGARAARTASASSATMIARLAIDAIGGRDLPDIQWLGQSPASRPPASCRQGRGNTGWCRRAANAARLSMGISEWRSGAPPRPQVRQREWRSRDAAGLRRDGRE